MTRRYDLYLHFSPTFNNALTETIIFKNRVYHFNTACYVITFFYTIFSLTYIYIYITLCTII